MLARHQPLSRPRGGGAVSLVPYVALCLAIAGFIVSVLLSLVRVEEDRQRRFANVGDSEWNAVQATAQLEKLSAVLERFANGDGSVDGDQLLQQYEIVWSRFRLLLDNPRNSSVASIRNAHDYLEAVDRRLVELEPVVQSLRPGDDAGYERIAAFIEEQRPWLVQLTRQVHDERVNADTQLGEIGDIYTETLVFLTLAVLSTSLLIFQLARGFGRARASLEEAKRARAAAQVAQQELRTVVDAVPVLIAAWDTDGRCLFANRLCNAFYGIGPGQVAEAGAAELEFFAGRHVGVSEVARTGSFAPSSEHLAVDAEGNERVLLSTLVPVRAETGEVLSIVGISLDVTERKQREVALSEARDRLARQAEDMRELAETAQRANQAKSLFLAMMSHEVRTPMNALLGFADLLADSPLLPDQRHHLSVVRETGRQLSALLSDILDFTRIEQGGIEVERVPFRLDGLLQSLQPLAGMLLAEKAVAFELKLDPDLPECVRGDPVRLKQVLTNLLANAAKFTTQGHVSLAVGREPDSGPTTIRFTVTDTGIGIEPARLPRLFQMFSQAEDDTHRRFGGTGLGLAICRRLVELMGGRISVESEPGRGSTFWFLLPLEPVAAAREADTVREIAAVSSSRVASRPLKVLVVDDVETNLQLLQALVRRAGHRVVTAVDGAEAVRAVGRDPPDLVLMDVNMPGMDGLEAARRIRRLDGAPGRVPIVALTANAFASDVEACRAAGMDGHLVKPIDVAALAATLARYSAAAASSDPPLATAVEHATAVLDVARLGALAEAVGIDQVNSLFRRMTREATTAVTAMRRALEAGDDEAVARAAHGLVGLAGNLGAVQLGEFARSVELLAQAGRLGEVAVGPATLGEFDQIRVRTAAAFEAWLAARPSERRVANA